MSADPRLLLSLCLCASMACAGDSAPELRDGDVIFHTSRSEQSEALQRAMHSPYSHMGLIFLRDGETVVLEVPPGTDEAKAMRLLERAEHVCLVTNSMTGTTHLDAKVSVAE